MKRPTVDVAPAHSLLPGELPSFISQQVTSARRYYFDLSPTKNKPLAIALGGWERVTSDYAISRKRFPYYSVEFVAEGEGTVTLEKDEYEMMPGTAFAYTPDVPLQIRTHSKKLMKKYYVTFTGHDAEKLLRSTGMFPHSVKRVPFPQDICDILELMLRYGLEQSSSSELLCRTLLPTLFTRIQDQSRIHPQADHSSTAYIRLRETLDQHYLTIKNIQEAAKICHITVSYACRLFKLYAHVSPHKYLTRLRMGHAADLLCNSNILIKQVAKQLDFQDSALFSRAFKRAFGVAPAHFRQHIAPKS
jgi:AraC-like DNA-binding protein